MIVIFGVGPREKIEAEGKFIFPTRNIINRYLVKTSRLYFWLFFIPIIPPEEKSEPGVKCQNCRGFYHIDVLNNNNYYLDGTPV